ncbi:TPA: cell wall-binding repeat-containing protein [Clostridioides difficile]
MKISKKRISLLTLSILTILVSGNTSDALTKNTLTGSGRWETAIKISQDGWSKADNAILVNDNSIVDALSSTPFARVKNAPILLTQGNNLDNRTKSELKRLGVKNVYLIGGKNTLGSNIENQLKSEKITSERISGNNRYETSLRLAERLDKEKDISKIVVVNGEKGLADAVSVGAAAAQDNMPIILSDSNNDIKIADKFIKEHNIKTSYIIGGVYSVSSSIEQKLPNSKRISGNNRNETNSKVIQEFYKNTDLKNLYVTKDGMKKQSDLIDSLAVGVLAAKNNSPVALVGSMLDSTQKDTLNTKKFEKVTQVGGLGNEHVVDEIVDMQEETIYTAKSIDALDVAIKRSDANDVIRFKPDKKITDSFKIETDKSITIEFSGEYSQTITVNMPNGDINNSGNMNDIIIKNIKAGTLTNTGEINGIDIYDNNGCRIENEYNGEIWLITILGESKDVYIKNDGEITKIVNYCSSVNIRNSGRINTVNGNKEPAISGNKPKVNTTEEDDDSDNLATGLYPEVTPCVPVKKGYAKVMLPQSARNSNYRIYYRVLANKPSAKKIDTKIDTSDWDLIYDTDPFEIKASNGYYVEVVEITVSNKKITRWGRTDQVDDGTKEQEVATGLHATVSFDGEDAKISVTSANPGCKLYYSIISSEPTPMKVGDKINFSRWEEIVGSGIVLKSSDLNKKYIELVEINNLDNTVTRWGTTNELNNI